MAGGKEDSSSEGVKKRGPRLSTVGQARRELGRQYRRMERGEINTLELSRIATALKIMVGLFEAESLEGRVADLEARWNR